MRLPIDQLINLSIYQFINLSIYQLIYPFIIIIIIIIIIKFVHKVLKENDARHKNRKEKKIRQKVLLSTNKSNDSCYLITAHMPSLSINMSFNTSISAVSLAGTLD